MLADHQRMKADRDPDRSDFSSIKGARSDFDFALPDELIAQHPLPERSASRLLHVRADGVADRQIGELPALLVPGDLLVMNDTRVIKARLLGRRDSGGRVEALVERIEGPRRARAPHMRRQVCLHRQLPLPGCGGGCGAHMQM